jgi:hypothetical protein
MNGTTAADPVEKLSKSLFLMIVGGTVGFLLATGALLTFFH